MWQKIASPPCNIPTHNWTRRVFISPKACPAGAKVLFWEGRTRDSSAQRTSWGSHYQWHCWNPLDERSAFRGRRRRGGLMSTGGTHLSSKEHFCLACPLLPAKCKSTPKTCLMDSQNFIPKGSLLGLWFCRNPEAGSPSLVLHELYLTI